MTYRAEHAFLRAGLIVVWAFGAGIVPPAASANEITLKETGSTLMYPLFQRWVTAYATVNPDVKIQIAATDSGQGIKSAIDRSSQIGTSDAYMSDDDATKYRRIISVPVAISAQTVNYNIPGVAALRLDGPTLSGIYSGRIREWDDPAISAMNPGTKLPHAAIVPVRRVDPSGDSFVFTQFLDFAAPQWDETVGYGTTVDWPTVPGEVGATGNAGMVTTIAATPNSVGYIGISYREEIEKAGLGTAVLKNQSGKFVLPSAETVSAAASTLDPRTPADERLSLVYAPGDGSYPLVNYEYVMVSIDQSNPDTAKAIKDFLLWSIALDGGNAAQFISPVGFIPLPDFIRAKGEAQIGRIK